MNVSSNALEAFPRDQQRESASFISMSRAHSSLCNVGERPVALSRVQGTALVMRVRGQVASRIAKQGDPRKLGSDRTARS